MPVFMTDRKSGERFALDKAIVLIGRHPDCDVVLDGSPKVSRRHCCVVQINHTFMIRDLGSMNGVRVNDELIRKEAMLKKGDKFTVGDIQFILEFVERSEKSRNELQENMGIDHELEKAADHSVNKNGSDFSPPVQSPPPSHPKRPLRDLNLSQSIPVVLEEEGKDFAVEDQCIEKSSYNLAPKIKPNDSQSDVVIIDELDDEESNHDSPQDD